MKKVMKSTLTAVWNIITMPIRAIYIVAKACEEKEYGSNGCCSTDCLVG